MDMSNYRELFLSEAREHLRALNETIIAMEANAADREKIDALFRFAHSIKGMAASMEYHGIADLAHRMEDLMDRVRKGNIPFAPEVADLLLEGHDLLDSMLENLEGGGDGKLDIDALVQKLVNYVPSSPQVEEPFAGRREDISPPPPPVGADAPVKTSANAAPEQGRDAHELQRTVRIKTELLDRLINITGEMITTKQQLLTIGKEVGSKKLDQAVEDFSKLLRELQNEVQKVRLLPFSGICDRFPRMARDLAKKRGKEIAFEVTGKEIEVDRGILEELLDPLTHMLRNAVDHGVEPPQERIGKGKKPEGRIHLSARREKDQVIVTIEDDGKGMQPARLVEAAVAKGFLKPEEARHISHGEALMLTCLPGFSTAGEVTDISGRGVGMDSVHSAIKGIGGSLLIQSEPERGTRITMKLPLTVAIIHILIVSCGDSTFGIPVTKILRMVDLQRAQILERGRKKVFLMDEQEIPLLSLARILGLPAARARSGTVPTLVAEMRGKRVGLAVDRFIGQQEVYIKSLGRPLSKLKGLSGGAILGNGQVIFIIDAANLV